MSALGIAGIIVLGVAILLLLISLLHPEGRRRPGGFLDGRDDAAQHGHDDAP